MAFREKEKRKLSTENDESNTIMTNTRLAPEFQYKIFARWGSTQTEDIVHLWNESHWNEFIKDLNKG